jgi:hypothetical protein
MGIDRWSSRFAKVDGIEIDKLLGEGLFDRKILEKYT